MNLEIEKMTESDFELIKNNLESDFDDFWNENILKKELENKNNIYIVAKDFETKEIVGFSGALVILDEAEIMNIVVKKSKRGQGIGKLLLEKIIKILKEKNVSKLKLEVNSKNFIAINLYKSFGFNKTGIRSKYYNSKDDAILMDLKI